MGGAKESPAAELAIHPSDARPVRFSFPGGIREVVGAIGVATSSDPALAVDWSLAKSAVVLWA